MVRLTRLERVLRVLTALYLIIAAVALLAPTRLPESEVTPVGLTAAPALVADSRARGVTAADEIVAANIFSLTRQPPAWRYDPLTFAREPSVPVPPPAYTQSATSEEESVPQLFGIVGGPHGTSALLRLDPASPGALLYRVGERGGAYRVEEINEQSVVLSGPAGRIVLRLVRQES